MVKIVQKHIRPITSNGKINIIGFFFNLHVITNCTFFDMCNQKILFLEFFILLSFVLIVFPDCCEKMLHIIVLGGEV